LRSKCEKILDHNSCLDDKEKTLKVFIAFNLDEGDVKNIIKDIVLN